MAVTAMEGAETGKLICPAGPLPTLGHIGSVEAASLQLAVGLHVARHGHPDKPTAPASPWQSGFAE